MEKLTNYLIVGSKGEKVLESTKPMINHKKTENDTISPAIKRRENTILSILLTKDINIFEVIQQNIKIEDFQDETNQKIAQKLYEELEKGNSNINSIMDKLEEKEQNRITEIMVDDYEIDDIEKAIDDIIHSYEKDKLNHRKFEILELLEGNTPMNQKKELEKELNEIIIRLARMK